MGGMIQFSVTTTPMGAVRMTQRGKWVKPTAQKYLSYKGLIAWEARKHIKEPLNGPVSVSMEFYFPTPKRKKTAEERGIYPTVKPDIDNCVKGVFDALNGIAWKDDNLVVEQQSIKRYDATPMIVIKIKEVSA